MGIKIKLSTNSKQSNLSIASKLAKCNKQNLQVYYTEFEFLYFLLNSSYVIIIAEHDGNIVGYILSKLSKINNNHHILSICVNEPYRRLNIGTKLFNYFLKTVKLTCNNITLFVHTKNYAANQFYLKNGFNIVTKLDNYYKGIFDDDSCDAYKMMRVL
jgi:ribosomal protein S18 acetylase RimI-like enzyme